MKLDTVNSHVRDEIKAFDAVKQYLLDEKVILPFFNLQEITTVVQAEIIGRAQVASAGQRRRPGQDFGVPEIRRMAQRQVDGPLWFRGYDQWSDEEGMAQIGKILEAYEAAHIVVGHTVQRGGRIRPAFRQQGVPDRYRHAQQLLPRRPAPPPWKSAAASNLPLSILDQQVVLVDPAAASSQGAAPAGVTGNATATSEKPGIPPAGQICCRNNGPAVRE